MAAAPKRPRSATPVRPRQEVKAELRRSFREPGKGLSWYCRVGSLLIELQQVRDETPESLASLADDLDTSEENLSKIRRFAADFTAAQMRELQALGVQWGQVTAVQSVKSAKRMPLLREAQQKKWGVDELKAVVKRRFGVHHAGGRPPRRPATARAGLCALQKRSERWLQFYEQVWNAEDGSIVTALAGVPKKDREAIAKLFPRVRETIRRVEVACESINAQLAKLERARRSN